MLNPPGGNRWPVVFARELSDTGIEFPMSKIDTVEIEEISVIRKKVPTP